MKNYYMEYKNVETGRTGVQNFYKALSEKIFITSHSSNPQCGDTIYLSAVVPHTPNRLAIRLIVKGLKRSMIPISEMTNRKGNYKVYEIEPDPSTPRPLVLTNSYSFIQGGILVKADRTKFLREYYEQYDREALYHYDRVGREVA